MPLETYLLFWYKKNNKNNNNKKKQQQQQKAVNNILKRHHVKHTNASGFPYLSLHACHFDYEENTQAISYFARHFSLSSRKFQEQISG